MLLFLVLLLQLHHWLTVLLLLLLLLLWTWQRGGLKQQLKCKLCKGRQCSNACLNGAACLHVQRSARSSSKAQQHITALCSR